jgi:hypothetical protein
MITVITPTIRPLGLTIVDRGLQRSTISCDEWLIGSSFEPSVGKWVKDDFEGGYWTLNRTLNKLVKESKGDLIVSIQDFTYFYPAALEKFKFYYDQNPKRIVSGIGDKYEQVVPTREKKVWADPRRSTGQGFRECPFYLIEGNFCAIPKEAIYSVGGFDESLDFKGFGLDFYGLLDRLDIKGEYSFHIDDSNESFSEVHGRVDNWDKDNITSGMYMEIHQKYLENPVLKYLP